MAGTTVVIELGTGHGVVDEDAPPPAGRQRLSTRTRMAVASGLLLLGCAAAAPAHPPLRDTATVPAPVGSIVSVTGDTLVVSDPTTAAPGPGSTLTAYSLPAGRPRWSVDLPVTGAYTAVRAGDLVLVSRRDESRRRVATIALTADSGRVAWQRRGAVLAVDGVGVGLGVNEVRSVSGRGWRIEGEMTGVDLATGRARWRADVANTAIVQVPPARGFALIIHDDGRLDVRDLVTGDLRGSRQLPPADYADDNPRVAGDMIVLRHYERRHAALTGYDLRSLRVQWERPDQARAARWVPCPAGLCARTPDDHWTLDPVDGLLTWQPGDGQPWRAIRGGGDRLVLRDLEDRRTLVASEVATTRPQVVGALPAGVGDCRAGDVAIVCRSSVAPDDLAVFRLPSS
jgi:outer membrane protein assembly factor BamB